MNRLPEEFSLHTDAAGSAHPDAFGPFRVLHQVGAGALGPVFRAFDPERDRLVAVKLFRLDLPPERVHQLVMAFERLIAADLKHLSIAAPVAAGIDGAQAYLAQDFVAADSLDIVLRDQGPVPPPDAVRVAVQLAAALDFAAVFNIAHGALHPRDVLLTSEDTRLTGVGIAQALEQVGASAPLRRPYAAPERVAGGPWDRRADIFSLAALLHEMLWGRRVAGAGAQAAEWLSELPGADLAALRVAFTRALAANPAERFDTALEFVEAVKHAFPDVVLASPAPPSARPSRRRPRPPVEEPPAVDLPRLPLDEDAIARPASDAPVPDDFEIRAAEASRAEDVEVAPSIVPAPIEPEPERAPEPEPEIQKAEPPQPEPIATYARPPASLLDLQFAEPPSSALERSRSAMWPLALALVVGLAMGFGIGWVVGSRERASAPVVATTPRTTPPAGREVTGGKVAEPPPAAPAASSPAPAAPIVAPAPARPAPPAVARGRLLVRTTPPGAQVTVDGRERGRTPTMIGDLASGEHRVRIGRDGYVTVERRVVISASRSERSLSVALARARMPRPAPPAPVAKKAGPGAVEVESRPPGARVYIDGRLVGTTPLARTPVPAGTHTVRLERGGYRLWVETVEVTAGEPSRVTASLTLEK